MRVQPIFHFATLAIICAVALGIAQPSSAGDLRSRRAASNATTAAPASNDVIAGSGPNGGRGIHAGGTVGDGSGGAIHYSGGAYSGPRGTAVRGSYTHLQSNGGVVHQGGHSIQGTNGGYDNGHNSYTHNPDGSSQGSWQNKGSGPNGSINSQGDFSRNSSGTLTGSSQTTASNARGSYDGSTSAANGTTTHDSDVTGANGDTYQGQTSYTKGEGYSHRGTCKNAQGNVIQCN